MGRLRVDIQGQHLDLKRWGMRGGLGDSATTNSYGDLGIDSGPTRFLSRYFHDETSGAETGAHPLYFASSLAGLGRGTM